MARPRLYRLRYLSYLYTTPRSYTTMLEVQKSKPHELRTAGQPRQSSFYQLKVYHISQINPTIRLVRFNIISSCDSLDWSGGNSESWLDVHIPNIKHAGGFTITSTPQDASPQPTTNAATDDSNSSLPYLELAVQFSPTNPAAKWFWQPVELILNTPVKVRVGGNFVWPPPNGMSFDEIKKIVLVAGGVGINPLISMISYIHQTRSSLPSSMVHLLYSTKVPSQSKSPPTIPIDRMIPSKAGNNVLTSPAFQILFLDRLQRILRNWDEGGENNNPLDIQLFITNMSSESGDGCTTNLRSDISDLDNRITTFDRRIGVEDLRRAIGENEEIRNGTVCYICGPPSMTDSIAKELQNILGDRKSEGKERVFFEKWW
ncbi:conserved hypothetical protein [Microsporum canis CBS 113480]|uniref:FAD-binding FR-type domain-containing protein n=1 Tax=Arthroderma otae (strain ATCC MYA-4605 / CBS 113480) TaxID=554155 RepID=C5FEU6_ARTOC|nr:conserved hypothetical protein [Microsporum canis CBS 113480]EEQ28240.1 conserved hypothetical protein [Microsporum canis CBS 113480]